MNKWFLSLLFLASSLTAQVDTAWVRYYRGVGVDQTRDLYVDQNGNSYVTGFSYDGSFNLDFLTIKYSSNGNEQLVLRYNGTANDSDMANAVTVDQQGNIYVTGTSKGIGSSGDFLTIKYDSSGNEKWIKRYNGSGNGPDGAGSIEVSSDGSVYVCGSSYNASNNYDYLTIKYDSSGNQRWLARYNGTGNGNDYTGKMSLDESGNIYVTGTSRAADGRNDFLTVKYDTAGTEKWVARNRFGYTCWCEDIVLDADKNVYIIGTYQIDFYRGGVCTTVKYDSLGVFQWANYFHSGPTMCYCSGNGITVGPLGYIYSSGQGYETSNGDNIATISYDSQGNERWLQIFSSSGYADDVPVDIAADHSGFIYILGDFAGQMIVLKYNSNGVFQWQYTHVASGQSISVDSGNSIYVTGYCYGYDWDYITIKLIQPAGIEENHARSNIAAKMLVYPNPLIGGGEIRFACPGEGMIKTLRIYDKTGALVRDLTDRIPDLSRSGSIGWTIGESSEPLASGIYFAVFDADAGAVVKQFVIIRR